MARGRGRHATSTQCSAGASATAEGGVGHFPNLHRAHTRREPAPRNLSVRGRPRAGRRRHAASTAAVVVIPSTSRWARGQQRHTQHRPGRDDLCRDRPRHDRVTGQVTAPPENARGSPDNRDCRLRCHGFRCHGSPHRMARGTQATEPRPLARSLGDRAWRRRAPEPAPRPCPQALGEDMKQRRPRPESVTTGQAGQANRG
jgi:hypothetical protein